MTKADLDAVLDRYPELRVGLSDHLDELLRIAERILEQEPSPPCAWAGLPDVERVRRFDEMYPPKATTVSAALEPRNEVRA